MMPFNHRSPGSIRSLVLRLLEGPPVVCQTLVVAVTANVLAAAAAPPRWNILFVFADDWGRYASCYRGLDGRRGLNDVVATPAIDRLAREGVVFRHAFVSSPSCTPCRSSLSRVGRSSPAAAARSC